MFNYISTLLSDPKTVIIFFLLALPGRALAISAHEYAHAWMADRCGDPTARNLGRLTLNPAKHLDLLGLVMMALVGFGWAKPVPVNPNNYRNYRRDDLKVSIAGICMNLILFLIGYLALIGFVSAALRSVPHVQSVYTAGENMFVGEYGGTLAFFNNNTYIPLNMIMENAVHISDFLIKPVFGRMASYVYSMISYFVQVNLVLAVFNLIPLPPLDGYHVVNDLLLRRPLFASPVTAYRAQMILLLLVLTGIVGKLLGFVTDFIYTGFGSVIFRILSLTGLL